MSHTQIHSRGMYFEDFVVGQQIVTAGRTVTESDIVNFAGLSGDFNQLHLDVEFSKQTLYGQRVAYGLLVLSMASGLANQTGFVDGTALAFREINDWKFSKPVFIGDTIHVEMAVKETAAIPSINGGAVTIAVMVKNQHEETVMKGLWKVLVISRPKASL